MPRAGHVAAFWFYLLNVFLLAWTQETPSPIRKLVQDGNQGKKTFSMTQKINPNWKPRRISTTTIYAAPFLKHKIPMPKELKTAVKEEKQAALENGTFPIHERVNGQTAVNTNGLYTFEVKIGTPVQKMNLMFDTGSGDFWVWSWLMPQTLTTGRNIYWGTNSSSSYFWQGQSYYAAYASGSSYGLVYQDTVTIDAPGGKFTVEGNPVECAQNVGGTSLPGLTGVDGMFGLNMWVNDSESPLPQQTWFNFIVPSLASPLFTSSLVRNGTGTFDFGYIDQTKYIGNIAYTPVATLASWPGSGYWMFNWTGFSFGNRQWNNTNLQVLTDSGTNLVLMPVSIAKAYYAQVKGSRQQNNGFWAFPCSSTLPTFTFGVGNARFSIKAKNMIYIDFDEGVNCLGAIQNTEEDNLIVFGTPWFEALFIVHDYGGRRIGFANRPGI
ncbi:aspartic peptidase domain-containing protein [Tricladium varicosporioides]|nr:aspartic peptidase domain-containing protein [Hymenoscyphus varicosporioides]